MEQKNFNIDDNMVEADCSVAEHFQKAFNYMKSAEDSFNRDEHLLKQLPIDLFSDLKVIISRNKTYETLMDILIEQLDKLVKK